MFQWDIKCLRKMRHKLIVEIIGLGNERCIVHIVICGVTTFTEC